MTKSDLDEVLTMAFMRGAESVGLEAMAFAGVIRGKNWAHVRSEVTL